MAASQRSDLERELVGVRRALLQVLSNRSLGSSAPPPSTAAHDDSADATGARDSDDSASSPHSRSLVIVDRIRDLIRSEAMQTVMAERGGASDSPSEAVAATAPATATDDVGQQQQQLSTGTQTAAVENGPRDTPAPPPPLQQLDADMSAAVQQLGKLQGVMRAAYTQILLVESVGAGGATPAVETGVELEDVRRRMGLCLAAAERALRSAATAGDAAPKTAAEAAQAVDEGSSGVFDSDGVEHDGAWASGYVSSLHCAAPSCFSPAIVGTIAAFAPAKKLRRLQRLQSWDRSALRRTRSNRRRSSTWLRCRRTSRPSASATRSWRRQSRLPRLRGSCPGVLVHW